MITARVFGRTAEGRIVTSFRVPGPDGLLAEILDWGAVLREVTVPGLPGSACLGFASMREYEASGSYAGAVVGRHAGRIARGCFCLNGREYHLACNDGPNHLHGGPGGLARQIWSASPEGDVLLLRIESPDGQEGYPGELTVTARYSWRGHELILDLEATSSADTVLSLTQHGYWNLSGERSAAGHLFRTAADTFAVTDRNNLVTGELRPVQGTPFDFRVPVALGQVWEGAYPQLIPGCGFDHTFPVPGAGMRELGSLYAPVSGFGMTICSDLPCLHLYTGLRSHAALEAQFIPDAVHHPEFPSVLLPAGRVWKHSIGWRFFRL